MDSTGVTKTMGGLDVFKTFRGQNPKEVFFADTIDAMTRKFLPPLIDKEAVFILRLWHVAVFGDVCLDELDSFVFKLYQAVSISFA